ncbi:hypothetical protein [Velocimicrobium porci]|uniref:hypothetical protein n=1 Tax=Velocimicrobium porci TaxID=2606634 RepID=UPI0012B26250|nr:hypothetical protein [Velocimicrobium porci]
MKIKNNKATPKKETKKQQDISSLKITSIYDDDNIPEIDTNTFTPDEVPRRDGPGGE